MKRIQWNYQENKGKQKFAGFSAMGKNDRAWKWKRPSWKNFAFFSFMFSKGSLKKLSKGENTKWKDGKLVAHEEITPAH